MEMNSQGHTQWNLPEGAKARIGDGYITGKIVYSPDGTQLVVPKSTGIWVYDASKLEVVDLIDEYRVFNADNAVGFSADGNLFAIRVERWDRPTSNSAAYTLQIWTRETEQSKSISIKCPEKIDSMVFSSDGNTLAGSTEGTIYLWDAHTGKLQNTLIVNGREIKSMVFSPDGSTLASTSQFIFYDEMYNSIYSYIDIWDTYTGGHKFNLDADSLLGFSPDGQMLAGRTYGDSVALWEANTGSCKFTFTHYHPSILDPYAPPHSYTDTSALGSATVLAFSPDGLTLASFSDDTIHMWDYHTGNCKSTFTVTSYITFLVFSPDGRTLAGGCEDGTVLLWDIDSSIDKTALTDNNPFIIPTIEDNNQTVLKEKDSEFQNRGSQIQQFCEDRGITTLCHFTRVENLQNILQEGLIGRSLLEEREQNFLFNDEDRADSNKEAVCLSISFPNYKMLWDIRKKKEKTERITDSQWIVLLFDEKVLWELDCAFCQTNAASGVVIPLLSDERIGEQKRLEALKAMFTDNFYASKRKIWIRRQDLQIPEHYTTDPQAEVLVFDPISAKYIKEVHFYAETARKQWLPRKPSTHSQTFSSNRDYFYGRSDSAFWKKETP